MTHPKELWERVLAEGDDCYRADTIEEVAKMAGVDPDILIQTVSRHNEMCEEGEDADFGKDPAFLVPIETAPYYIAVIHIEMETSVGGLEIDRTFHVIDSDGNPVENVFAIGMDGNMPYRNVYPISIPELQARNASMEVESRQIKPTRCFTRAK